MNMRSNVYVGILVACFSTIFSMSGVTQKVLTSQQAYDYAQQSRSEAAHFWQKTKASDHDYDQGIQILTNTIGFLDSLPIKELAQGNHFLKAKSSDVYYDLIIAYLLGGRNDEALNTFEKYCEEGSYAWISDFEKDPIYAPIRSNARFIAIIKILKDREDLWTDNALSTPFEATLTYPQRVAGLSLLWSQAKYNFVHFDHAGIDWDKTYLKYLALLQASDNTFDYYKILMKFYAELKDGHSNVYPPKELTNIFYSRPPIRTELKEGRVFITEVFSDSLKRNNIIAGVEILKINNKAVISFAKNYVEPYQSSSTQQDLEVRTFTYALLAGDSALPVTLELKSVSGKIWTVSIGRSGYKDLIVKPTLEYKKIGSTGYLTLSSFESNSVMRQFDSLFSEIATTKNLIIDLRNNGGGNSSVGYHILGCLTDKPFKISSSSIMKSFALPGPSPSMQWDDFNSNEMLPNGKFFYSKPITVLTSARTFSAAEDFVVAFNYMKRGLLIGQKTGGSSGQPVSFKLPGGGTARVCAKRESYPDGKKFIGIGIIPDKIIERKVISIVTNKDETLKAALEMLNE